MEPAEETVPEQTSEEKKVQNLTIGNVCDICEGSGLIGDPLSAKNKVCENCRGTGKHQLIPPGTYRSGTILVVKGLGAFKINDFGELRQI